MTDREGCWTLLQLQKKEIENHFKCYKALGKSNEVSIGRTALDLELRRRDVEVVVMEEMNYGI